MLLQQGICPTEVGSQEIGVGSQGKNDARDQHIAVSSMSSPSRSALDELESRVTGLQPSLSTLLKTLEPVLVARLSARPYPEIHERARLAKVPVIMYHDILPTKEVFFDVTPEEFEAHLQLIQESGATPISLQQLTNHLTTGMPLPEKPVLLSFDDGYAGHYEHVYPLLRKYGYPGVFAIYTSKVGTNVGRSSLTWEQLRAMATDPLVTIASHSITHPEDLRGLPNERLRREIVESKRILETELGIAIDYFVYPVGKYDEQVQYWVQLAGYKAALTMNDEVDRFAGESESLLSIERIGQSKLEEAIAQAWGGPPLPPLGSDFNFAAPIRLNRATIDDTPLIFISGGKPITIHANSRYQVPEIIANTEAIAAVDGGFFSLKYLDSNVMIGPVLSQSTNLFVPGNASENPKLRGRPLVLITPAAVEFIPFDPARHNLLEGLLATHPDVTDAFVAAAWLVKDGEPQPPEAFASLSDFDANRHRAFWGIDYAGQPVIGVSTQRVDSVSLGQILAKAGLQNAVMLDSGASTALAYQGELLVEYEPRPVPHVVALVPPKLAENTPCLVANDQTPTQQSSNEQLQD
jgi:peptidoglycan/xylan/chitin deacetylase (PgdA/CDA1 family)